jgi:hypothetical protein
LQHFIYLVVGFLNLVSLMAFGSFLAFALDPGQRSVLLGFIVMGITLAPGFLLWKQLLLIQGIHAKSTSSPPLGLTVSVAAYKTGFSPYRETRSPMRTMAWPKARCR